MQISAGVGLLQAGEEVHPEEAHCRLRLAMVLHIERAVRIVSRGMKRRIAQKAKRVVCKCTYGHGAQSGEKGAPRADRVMQQSGISKTFGPERDGLAP